MLKKKKKAQNGVKRKTEDQQKVKRHQQLFRILIGIGMVALLSSLYPKRIPFQFTDLKAGDISQKDIIAPFDFSILMTPDELKTKREAARSAIIPVFDFDQELTRQQLNTVTRFFSSLEKIYATKRMSDSAFYRITREWPDGITKRTVALIRKEGRRRRYQKGMMVAREGVNKALQEYYTVGIVTRKTAYKLTSSNPIYLKSDSSTKIKTFLRDLYDVAACKKSVLSALRRQYPRSPEHVEAWINIFTELLVPNVRYNRKETTRLRDEAAAQVPLSKGIIYKGEKVLDAHKRVSQADVNVLRSLAIKKKETEFKKNVWGILFPISGRILASLVVVILMVVYLTRYRPRVYYSTRMILLLSLIGAIVMGMAAAITTAELPKYLVPISLGSMLITILFDLETAVFSTLALSLLIGNIQGFDYKITLVSFIAGFIGILSVMRVRHRSEFYRSMLFVPLAYIVAILMIGLLSFQPFKEILRDCSYGVANGILSTILTIGILPICETLFKRSTDITLLELSDLNRPLLKQLALDAPGTYHHSIVVGNLAEAGAEHVGANSLLARVGSYYHDIGKLKNPEYFVENQKDFPQNKHDNLSPSMSSLILTAHTKNGAELARRRNLPSAIMDIIQQHHGTSLMSYFYQRALETQKDGKDISEQDFRYPGPRPQTKEAAIVMLADSVEAASRTLKEPTTTRLKGMVNDIIEGIFRDGQLDECELTFKDLTKIKQRFLPVLTGIFHNRVDYPEPQRQQEKDRRPKTQGKEKNAPHRAV